MGAVRHEVSNTDGEIFGALSRLTPFNQSSRLSRQETASIPFSQAALPKGNRVDLALHVHPAAC